MTVQPVEVAIGGTILPAEALDLIHETLLLRLHASRPLARGEQVPGAVTMPGSGQVNGSLVGIDGPLVRFEPRPSHAVTQATRLAPRKQASAGEAVVVNRAAPPAPPVAPAQPAAAVTADVMSIATGRNEVPQRVPVLGISATGARLSGFSVPAGRRLVVTLAIRGTPPFRVRATAGQVGAGGTDVAFQFGDQNEQQRLIAALSGAGLRA